MMTTPLVFIIFNRPEVTKRVFDAIRNARPKRLFVIADGPRNDHPEDQGLCARTRAVVDYVDWPCEVVRDYAETNMGCGKRPASGISHVFTQVEEAIILEDDCLPHPSFFPYCEELLARYRDDERIMAICGTNFQPGISRSPYSYYFSLFPHCTGWASWQRAWQHYDYDMSLLPEVLEQGWIESIFPDKKAARYWKTRFREVSGIPQSHIWDFQWTFACWIQGGLSIIPRNNLVTNIGYGPTATHTKSETDRFANLTVKEISFPLLHPPFVIRDSQTDNHGLNWIYNINFKTDLILAVKEFLRARSLWC